MIFNNRNNWMVTVLFGLLSLLMACNSSTDMDSVVEEPQAFLSLDIEESKAFELPFSSTRAANPNDENINSLYILFFRHEGNKQFISFAEGKSTIPNRYTIPISKELTDIALDIAVVTNVDRDMLQDIVIGQSYENVINTLTFEPYSSSVNSEFPYWGIIPETILSSDRKNKLSIQLVRSLASFSLDASSLPQALQEVHLGTRLQYANIGFGVINNDINRLNLPNASSKIGVSTKKINTPIIANQVQDLPLVESLGSASYLILRMDGRYYRMDVPYTVKRNNRYHFQLLKLNGLGYDSIESAVLGESNINYEVILWEDFVLEGVALSGKYLGWEETFVYFVRKDISTYGTGQIQIQTNLTTADIQTEIVLTESNSSSSPNELFSVEISQVGNNQYLNIIKSSHNVASKYHYVGVVYLYYQNQLLSSFGFEWSYK